MLKTIPTTSLTGAKVLVVDDEPTNHLVIEGLLAPTGCQVQLANSGSEALAMVAEAAPDVVLLDAMMPDLDGFAVCRALKSDPATALIPVVMITALDADQHRLRGLQVGVEDFLTKPVDHIELEVRVRSLVERSRLQARLHTTESVLMTLATAIDLRDDVTGGHVRRLAHNATLFSTALALEARETEVLRWAAMLHDVGKIGVPDAILNKPGPLDEAEWDVMRQHAVLGDAIVAPLEAIDEVRPIVLHHHERWDGAGYPDGLHGEDIPYLARVFQLLDVFDALTAPRSYKPARSRQDAIAIMREMAGSALDPYLAEIFLSQVASQCQVEQEVSS